MRILKEDRKAGFLHVQADSPEDLWLLSWLLSPGDNVRGSTERKLKIGGEDARNQKVVRKKMTLTITCEKAAYEHDTLRVLGTIIDGPDDVARGDHHSLTIDEGDTVGITKHGGWAAWQHQKIIEATKQTSENILAVLFDREQALYAKLDGKGTHVLGSIAGNVQKKDAEESRTSNFYKEIAAQLADYDNRYKPRSIIAASASFWKEYLAKELSGELQKKMIYATVSDVGEQALVELVKRPELKTALEKDRSAQEERLISDLLAAISKDKASYGTDHVEAKAAEGSLKDVYISTGRISASREDGTWERIDALLKTAESSKTDIHIITTKEAGKQLDGLGGIAGINRW